MELIVSVILMSFLADVVIQQGRKESLQANQSVCTINTQIFVSKEAIAHVFSLFLRTTATCIRESNVLFQTKQVL